FRARSAGYSERQCIGLVMVLAFVGGAIQAKKSERQSRKNKNRQRSESAHLKILHGQGRRLVARTIRFSARSMARRLREGFGWFGQRLGIDPRSHGWPRSDDLRIMRVFGEIDGFAQHGWRTA